MAEWRYSGGVNYSFFESSLDLILEAYANWFETNTNECEITIFDDLELEEQFEEWLDQQGVIYSYISSLDRPKIHDYHSGSFTINRDQFKEKEMNTIEQLKKQAMNQLEALQKVGMDVEALKAKLSDVSLETLIEAFIKAEVTKIDNYAKRQKIDFRVDTAELVKLVKLPNGLSDKKPAQILPFVPREGSTLEDQSWTEWKVVDGEWTDSWYNSWQSSSESC
jgi:hypothetical protein